MSEGSNNAREISLGNDFGAVTVRVLTQTECTARHLTYLLIVVVIPRTLPGLLRYVNKHMNQ
jgi:hypothetical protein